MMIGVAGVVGVVPELLSAVVPSMVSGFVIFGRTVVGLILHVRVDAAHILSPAQGETGLMLTSGRMRLAGMF